MGKFNKPKPEKLDKYKRFCPKCGRQGYWWKCPTDGTPTRKLNMIPTIGDKIR